MNAKTWSERALPFTAACSLAVLLMALVVSPLHAQQGGYNPCTQCIQWVNSNPNSPCFGLTGPALNQCTWQWVPYYCNSSNSPFKDSQGRPPCQQPPPGGGSPLPDCGSEACNFYNGIPDVILCSWDCWNRFCDSNESNRRCLDVWRRCKPEDTTARCADCKCCEGSDGTNCR